MFVCVYGTDGTDGTADEHQVERINISILEMYFCIALRGVIGLEKSFSACKFNVKIPGSKDLFSFFPVVLFTIYLPWRIYVVKDFVSHGKVPPLMPIRYVSRARFTNQGKRSSSNVP